MASCWLVPMSKPSPYVKHWWMKELTELKKEKNRLSNCAYRQRGLPGDEPPHQILSYTLLFSLFLYFLYIVNPPLCAPTLMRLHTITLTSSDLSCLFDGHMFYDSHVLLLFLVSPMCALPQSDQSWALTLHSQALTIASLRMSLMLTFLLTICI